MTTSLEQLRESTERAELLAKRADATARKTASLRTTRLLRSRNRPVALGDFSSATRTRLRAGSRARGGSDDSHRDWRTLYNLRRDCQSLVRNNPLARAVVERIAALAVGRGWTPQVKSGDADWDRTIERLWKRRANACNESGELDLCADVTGQLSLHSMARAIIEHQMVDGAVGLVRITGGSWQPIEAERFKNPGNQANDEKFVNGCEMDAYGRPIAYHVAEWGRGGYYAETKTEKIVADDIAVFNCPIARRMAGHWSEPALAATITRFERLDDLDMAVLTAMEMAACHAIFHKSAAGPAKQTLVPGETVTRTDGTTQREAWVEPGMIIYGDEGDEMSTLAPNQPHQEHESFFLLQLAQIGASIGLPLSLLLLDMRQVNFSSARMAVVLAWSNFNTWLDQIERFYMLDYRHWVNALLESGAIWWPRAEQRKASQAWDNVRWIRSPMPVVDPKVAAEADEKDLASGVKTRRRVVEERYGADIEEHVDELAREQHLMRDAGVVLGQPEDGLTQEAGLADA